MPSAHIQAAQETLQQWLADPKAAAVFSDYFAGLKEGRWSREYIDAIGQDYRHSPDRWPPEQVPAFAQIHSHLMQGEISQVVIGVGTMPRRDDARGANGEALTDLPAPFAASVDMEQNHGDEDGVLEWSEPIVVEKSLGVSYYEPGISNPSPVIVPHVIRPGRVPLEIGTTAASRTILHLAFDGGVARWAYGSETIRLFVASDFPLGLHPARKLAY